MAIILRYLQPTKIAHKIVFIRDTWLEEYNQNMPQHTKLKVTQKCNILPCDAIINNTLECQAKFKNADVQYGDLYNNFNQDDLPIKFTYEKCR